MSVRKTVEIATQTGPELVNAVVFGTWAAHRSRGVDGSDLDWYTTTHVPTGLCLRSVTGKLSRSEAEKLAAELEAAGPLEIEVGAVNPRTPNSHRPKGAGVERLKEIVAFGAWRDPGDGA